MSTVEKPPSVPAEDIAALEDAISDILKGVRNSRKMDEAGRELDEGREEIRRRLGETDIAAALTDPEDE